MFHLNLAFKIVSACFFFGMIGVHQLLFRSAMSDIRGPMKSVGGGVAMESGGDKPWAGVGMSEEAAKKQVEGLSRAFSPTQPCTYDAMYSARKELADLRSRLSPQARFRLWAHLEAIKLYEERHPDVSYEQARANRRGGAPPIDCEKSVVALAVARRG